MLDEQQKIYSLNLEQTKTISQIPTDNAFFKKWMMANHEENIKSIENVSVKLEEMGNRIGSLKTSVDNIGVQRGGNAVKIAPKDNVETISL